MGSAIDPGNGGRALTARTALVTAQPPAMPARQGTPGAGIYRTRLDATARGSRTSVQYGVPARISNTSSLWQRAANPCTPPEARSQTLPASLTSPCHPVPELDARSVTSRRIVRAFIEYARGSLSRQRREAIALCQQTRTFCGRAPLRVSAIIERASSPCRIGPPGKLVPGTSGVTGGNARERFPTPPALRWAEARP